MTQKDRKALAEALEGAIKGTKAKIRFHDFGELLGANSEVQLFLAAHDLIAGWDEPAIIDEKEPEPEKPKEKTNKRKRDAESQIGQLIGDITPQVEKLIYQIYPTRVFRGIYVKLDAPDSFPPFEYVTASVRKAGRPSDAFSLTRTFLSIHGLYDVQEPGRKNVWRSPKIADSIRATLDFARNCSLGLQIEPSWRYIDEALARARIGRFIDTHGFPRSTKITDPIRPWLDRGIRHYKRPWARVHS